MLSKTERTQIRQLLQSPQYTAFDKLVNELKEKYRDEYASRDTEWDTIKNTLINEGKIRGITELVQELFKHAQNDQ